MNSSEVCFIETEKEGNKSVQTIDKKKNVVTSGPPPHTDAVYSRCARMCAVPERTLYTHPITTTPSRTILCVFKITYNRNTAILK